MKKKFLAILAMAVFTVNTGVTCAATPEVPENIYKWVQSSDRTSYYFNKEQICFAKNADDTINSQKLVVPVLKLFDDVMINDVVAKRRWNGLTLHGFDDLQGAAEYLQIDLNTKEIIVEEVDFLDSTWTALEQVKLEKKIKLDTLSPKSLDYKFYSRIIDFSQRNQLKLALRVNRNLDTSEQDKFAQAQAEYRAANKPEKLEDNE